LSETLHSEPNTQRDARWWLLLIAVAVIVLDRATKVVVAKYVEMGGGIVVVPHIFRISHVLNTGAAFSMFADSASPIAVRLGLVVFSLLVTIGIAFLLWRYGRTWSLASIGFALILGGAIGNLYDRTVLHYVVDFLEVHIGSYHWPDFNVADSAICVGAVLLLAEMIWPSEDATKQQQISESASQQDA
jgi:signal peptidase II